jgi:pSer/pThr/pTyr-binding forkhead associated (FHA) protein
MPHLTLVEKGSEKSHRVEGTDILVGRDPACAIYVDGDHAKTVSGRHARLFVDDSRWYVEDAGSRNGTFIGQRKLEAGARHPIAVGDVIGLGMTGTQLTVREAVGTRLAATMAEAPPVPRANPAKGASPRPLDDTAKIVRVVLRSETSGAQYVGQAERITIGRALDCIIRVEGESATSVSRMHAEVLVLNGQISLRDGGSRHGTYLNGQRIADVIALRQGDAIMLGPGGPAFILDEASMVSPARSAAMSSASASPAAKDAAIGPSGVRGAARSANREAPAERDAQPAFSYQPTPALGQPSFTKSTPPAFEKATSPDRPALRKSPTRAAANGKPSRPRAAVWAGLGVLLLIVAALVIWVF